MYEVPRSKHHAQEEYTWAYKNPEDLSVPEATITQIIEHPPYTYPYFKDICYGSFPEIYCNPYRRIASTTTPVSTTTTTVVASSTTSNKGTHKKAKGKTRSRQDSKVPKNSIEALDDSVMLLVQYLLYKYELKESVTQGELLRNVIPIDNKHFPKILKKVSDCLEFAFGIDLKALGPSMRIYTLKNKLGPNSDAGVSTGLLLTILGVIFMNGNSAKEEQVWKTLRKMGVYDGKEHYVFGDTRKLITEDLVEKKYLKYQEVPNTDPPRYEFLWGPRAHTETSKMKVLEFYAKSHNTTTLAYPSYYKEALKDEEERSRARVKERARTAIAKARFRTVYSYCSHASRI